MNHRIKRHIVPGILLSAVLLTPTLAAQQNAADNAAKTKAVEAEMKKKAEERRKEVQERFNEFHKIANSGDVEKMQTAFNSLFADCKKELNDNQLKSVYNAKMNGLRKAKKESDADLVFDEAAADKDLSPETRADFEFRKMDALYNSLNRGMGTYSNEIPEQCIERCNAILKNPDYTNLDKITAYLKIADYRLECVAGGKDDTEDESYIAEAKKWLEKRHENLQDLSLQEEEKTYLEFETAKIFARINRDWSQAANTMKKLLEKLPKQKQSQAFNAIVDCLKKADRADDAKKMMLAKISPDDKLRMGDCYASFKDKEKMLECYLSVLDTKVDPANQKAVDLQNKTAKSVFLKLMAYFTNARDSDPRDLEMAAKLYNQYFPGFQKAGLIDDAFYTAFLWNPTSEILKDPVMKKSILSTYPDLKQDNAKLRIWKMILDQALKDGDFKRYQAGVDKMLTIESLKPEEKLNWTLLRIALANKDAKDLAAKVKAAIPADTPAKNQAEAVLQAARAMYALNLEGSAKALWALRESMLVPEPKRSMKLQFIAGGPETPEQFRASDYWKQTANRGKIDRKYGDNLQFLLDTDAAITSRAVTQAADGKEFRPAEFVATCNENGVSIFIMTYADDMKAVREGFREIGGFEMYVTSGKDMPYYCFLFGTRPDTEISDTFPTQYDNRNYRRTLEKNKTVSIRNEYFDDGVGTLVFIPWRTVFFNLPKDGSVWEFEPLQWEKGGWSWGGSKSVHNRSSFGDLVFSGLTPKALTDIKRRLLPEAKNIYGLAKNANRNGYLEIWQDPVLGDREFFKKEVEPLQKELEEALAKIKPDMSDAEVNNIWEAAKTAMNINYILQEMRSRYLLKKMTEE